jgi:hypothetical protein
MTRFATVDWRDFFFVQKREFFDFFGGIFSTFAWISGNRTFDLRAWISHIFPFALPPSEGSFQSFGVKTPVLNHRKKRGNDLQERGDSERIFLFIKKSLIEGIVAKVFSSRNQREKKDRIGESQPFRKPHPFRIKLSSPREIASLVSLEGLGLIPVRGGFYPKYITQGSFSERLVFSYPVFLLSSLSGQ